MERAISGLHKLATRKSTKDFSTLHKEFPTEASAYEILDDCGRGVSATVHRALCRPLHEIVAVKKMNLESLNCDLDEIIHEAQTMKAYNHPCVLPLYCSFVDGSDLWMVMPFISGGSVLHIMKYAHPEGLDEVMIATIMKEVLKALEYVHKQGGIHRDIKAGNILIDMEGRTKLGDFGVAASLERGGSWGHDKGVRMTFVGTPCWMAPEVMEQTAGYDQSADIWSVGITMLEMAHGHAPFAKFPPMKVLLMTLQNPPPTLDDKGKKHFSKAIKDVVARCLQKDPKLRPTASQLLEHKFFKQAKDEEFLQKFLMANLPPLGERVQEIRQGRAATNAFDNDKNFARSQEEYKKGVSSWNFDVGALKMAAANEPDEDPDGPLLPTINEADEFSMVDTLSKSDAASAATAILRQASASLQRTSSGSGAALTSTAPAASSSVAPSVFATPAGQMLAASSMPAPLMVTDAVTAPLTTTEGAAVVASPGEVPPASPGNISPAPGLSREGSSQGPLNTLSTSSTTPTGVAQKKGRFTTYVGEGAPAWSPNNSSAKEEPASGSSVGLKPFFSSMNDLISGRASEDGSRQGDRQEGDTLLATAATDTAVESMRVVGRFRVVENNGMSKTNSLANLSDAGKRDVRSEAGKEPTGRPPAGPSAVPPVTVLMPRLQELLDHAAQQQIALQKLVAAIQDADKGKIPSLLSRTQSTKSLFAEGSRTAGSGGGDMADSPEDARAQTEQLRQRVAELEMENSKLRARNQQLEQLAGTGSELGSTTTSANYGNEVTMASITSARLSDEDAKSHPISPTR